MSITSTYVVEGMTCDHCVRSVSAEVGSLDGVTDVDVDLATGQVVVSSDAELDRSAVSDAIEEAGYVLSS